MQSVSFVGPHPVAFRSNPGKQVQFQGRKVQRPVDEEWEATVATRGTTSLHKKVVGRLHAMVHDLIHGSVTRQVSEIHNHLLIYALNNHPGVNDILTYHSRSKDRAMDGYKRGDGLEDFVLEIFVKDEQAAREIREGLNRTDVRRHSYVNSFKGRWDYFTNERKFWKTIVPKDHYLGVPFKITVGETPPFWRHFFMNKEAVSQNYWDQNPEERQAAFADQDLSA